MKRVALEETALTVPELVKIARKEAVILTRRGKPLVAVRPLSGHDWESLALANSSKFQAILEDSMRSYRKEGGIPIDEVRGQLGLEKKPKKKTLRDSKKTRSAMDS